MKKITFFLFAFIALALNSCVAQSGISTQTSSDLITAKKYLQLRNHYVNTIELDTAFNSDTAIATSKQIRDFVVGRIAGILANMTLQGAIDNDNRLEDDTLNSQNNSLHWDSLSNFVMQASYYALQDENGNDLLDLNKYGGLFNLNVIHSNQFSNVSNDYNGGIYFDYNDGTANTSNSQFTEDGFQIGVTSSGSNFSSVVGYNSGELDLYSNFTSTPSQSFDFGANGYFGMNTPYTGSWQTLQYTNPDGTYEKFVGNGGNLFENEYDDNYGGWYRQYNNGTSTTASTYFNTNGCGIGVTQGSVNYETIQGGSSGEFDLFGSDGTNQWETQYISGTGNVGLYGHQNGYQFNTMYREPNGTNAWNTYDNTTGQTTSVMAQYSQTTGTFEFGTTDAEEDYPQDRFVIEGGSDVGKVDVENADLYLTKKPDSVSGAHKLLAWNAADNKVDYVDASSIDPGIQDVYNNDNTLRNTYTEMILPNPGMEYAIRQYSGSTGLQITTQDEGGTTAMLGDSAFGFKTDNEQPLIEIGDHTGIDEIFVHPTYTAINTDSMKASSLAGGGTVATTTTGLFYNIHTPVIVATNYLPSLVSPLTDTVLNYTTGDSDAQYTINPSLYITSQTGGADYSMYVDFTDESGTTASLYLYFVQSDGSGAIVKTTEGIGECGFIGGTTFRAKANTDITVKVSNSDSGSGAGLLNAGANIVKY